MLILALGSAFVFFLKRKSGGRKIYYLGFIISAVSGIFIENFGIHSGLWTYHDLSGGREFPYWLPFAWGLAFSMLHDFETHCIRILQIKRMETKILLTLTATALLPTLGEMVAINLGVWTYAGSYKVLGVPFYAIGLLMLFHTSVFLLLYRINLVWKTPDAVFGDNLQNMTAGVNQAEMN